MRDKNVTSPLRKTFFGKAPAITGLDLDDPRDVVQVYLAAQSVA